MALQEDLDTARETIRELHGLLKDARYTVRELRDQQTALQEFISASSVKVVENVNVAISSGAIDSLLVAALSQITKSVVGVPIDRLAEVIVEHELLTGTLLPPNAPHLLAQRLKDELRVDGCTCQFRIYALAMRRDGVTHAAHTHELGCKYRSFTLTDLDEEFVCEGWGEDEDD